MGIMSFEDTNKFQTENAGLFILPDDGDTVKVKVLIESIKDVFGYMIHYVRHEGKQRKIECKRNHAGEPMENCPLCASGNRMFTKYFIPLWNFSTDSFQYWERGTTFKRKLVTLCENYYPVHDEIFEIERIGVKGDPNTDYVFECVTDSFVSRNEDIDVDFNLSTLNVPEVFDPESNIVISKTDEEIAYFVENGKFMDDNFNYSDEGRSDFQARRNERGGGRRDNNQDEGQSRRSGGYSSRRNTEEPDRNAGYSSRANRRREF